MLAQENKLQYWGFLRIPQLWNNSKISHFQPFQLLEEGTEQDLDYDEILPENTLLGKRAERFFSYYIQHHDRYELLVENLQIIQNKTTVGELDFVLHDHKKDEILHVELVCKIYLQEEPNKNKWIGPNRKDGLQEKLSKLQNKQFPLLYQPFTQKILLGLGINPSEIHQQLCFKALLFVYKHNDYPYTNDHINSNCIVGWWIYLREFEAKRYKKASFFIPQKKNWFVNPMFHSEWYSFEVIKKEIIQHHKNKNAPLCWMKKKDNSIERFFVVWW